MAKQRYFQWLIGERQGEVMTLHHTEKEGGVGYLVFTDGSKCNIALVAPLNDFNAFKHHKFMAEVYDTINVWHFEKKLFRNDGKMQIDDDGVEHEGWDPYHDKAANGGRKPYHRLEVIPPRRTVTDAMEAMSYGRVGFVQSLMGMGEGDVNTIQTKMGYEYEDKIIKGKEFLDHPTVGLPTGNDMKKYSSEAGLYIPEDVLNNTTDALNENHLGVEMPEENQAVVPQLAVPQPQPVPQAAPLVIDEPKNDGPIDLASDTDNETIIEDDMAKQKFTYQGKQYEVDNEELLAFLANKEKDSVPSDSPAISIVKNCKKKESQVSLTLDLKIPGRKVFKLIDEDYNENVLDDFFTLVMRDIDTEVIRDRLKETLIKAYKEEEQAE
jgi:hypothetical protein